MTHQMARDTFFTLLMFSASLFIGCSSENSKSTGGDTSAANIKPLTPAVKVRFKEENINAVYEHYVSLKNFLVKSDASQAQSSAAALEKALTATDNDKGAEIAKNIAGTNDLAQQRSHFNDLTSEVENTLRAGALSSGTIFKQYCPMANNGDGGYWFSGESEIRNPYYGDDMLECGEVKEEIK